MPLEEAGMIVQLLEMARQARHESMILRGMHMQQATLISPNKLQRDESERERYRNVINVL